MNWQQIIENAHPKLIIIIICLGQMLHVDNNMSKCFSNSNRLVICLIT